MAASNQIVVELLLANNQYLAQLSKSQAETGKAAKGISASLASSFTAIKGGVIAAAFSQTASKVLEVVQEVGRLDTVTRAYNSTMARAGAVGADVTKGLQEATKGALSMEAAMEGSTMAVNLMGSDVVKQLPEMARIAKAAARTAGTSVDQMYKDIITASGRQSVQILDNLGISSAQASLHMDEYAASLGKSRNQLTASEKSAAFFHATMKAGGEIIKNAGDEALTHGEKLQVAGNNWENLKRSFYTGASEGVGSAVTALTMETEGATSAAGLMGQAFGRAAEIVGNKLSAVVGVFDTASWGKKDYWVNMGLLAADGITFGAATATRKAFGLGKEFGDEYANGILAGGVTKMVENLGLAAVDALKMAREAAAKQKGSGPAPGGGTSAVDDISSVMDAAAAEWQKKQDDMVSSTQSMVNTVMSGMSSMVSGVGSLYDAASERAIQSLARVSDYMSMALDYQYQRQLEAQGLQDEARSVALGKEVADLERQMTRTRGLSKKKALQQQIDQKKDEQKKYEIQEQYEQKKQNLEIVMDLYRAMLQRRQFERNKQYQLAAVWINTAAAITAAWLSAWSLGFPIAAIAMGAISTALLLANAGVQTALISSQRAPMFEQGSWSVPNTGPAYIHQDELIMPKPFADDFREAAQSGGGENIHVHLYLDGKQIHEEIVRREDKMARLLGAKSRFSFAGAYG